LPITSAGRFSPLGPLGTLITLALGQFFDWRFVAFRTILAGGNPKLPALVTLDPDAVLVYPTVLYFADSVCHSAQIRRPQAAAPALVNGVKIQTETLPKFGPLIYNGRRITKWDTMVCSRCPERNWDGIVPEKHPDLIPHLRSRGIEVKLNARGWIDWPS
jgi:hypothetical protein